jgi:hypothetical protein
MLRQTRVSAEAPGNARFRAVRLLAASLLIGAGAAPAPAQSRPVPGAIDGVVTDTNLVSLGDANASILGSGIQVVTGANGRFRILGLPAGHYILIVRRLGYAPTSTALQVAGGDTLRVSFALEKVATALDPVVIEEKRLSPKMAEFEYRKKLGFGHFMTQADIDKRNTPFTSELLRTIMSVRVFPTRTGKHVAISVRGCTYRLFVDGVLMPTGNLDDLPAPTYYAGIEIFDGPAQVPPQYGSNGCVILFWTKDGP